MLRFIFIILFFAAQYVSADEKVKIGVLLPLSGPLASAGSALQQGIRLAATENNNQSIQFIFDDHQYAAAQAVSSLRKLIDQDRIQALMIFGGPTSMAIKKVVEDKKLPTISFSATLPLEQGGNGSITRIWESADDMGFLIAEACKKLAAKQIAIVSAENDATLSIKSEVAKNLPAPFAFEEQILLGEQDFSGLVTRIRSAHPDVIISNLLAGQHAVFISKLREQAVKVPIVMQSSVFFDAKTRKPYPKIFEDAFVATVDDSRAGDFYNSLKLNGFESEAVYMAALAYDSTKFLLAAINDGWKFTVPFPKVNTEGILGHYKRPRETSFSPPMNLLKFQNGALISEF